MWGRIACDVEARGRRAFFEGHPLSRPESDGHGGSAARVTSGAPSAGGWSAGGSAWVRKSGYA
jgi:hypothetical protein